MKRLITIVLVGLVVVLLGGLVTGVAQEGKVVLTFASHQESMCLDPAKPVDETEVGCIVNCYDALVRMLKMGEVPVPWLAESWDVTEDGLTYTFHLRKGVPFHDGTEVTAEDVAFSMDRMLRIKRGYSWLWEKILDPGDVEDIDNYTVTFHLNKPFGPFLSTLLQFPIANKDLIMENIRPGDFGEFGDYGQQYLEAHDAGSGPYIAEDVQLGERIIFRKFDEYWKGWEEGQVDEGRWLVVPESATAVVMLKKGEADISDKWLVPEQFEDLAATPGVQVIETYQLQTYVIHMHNKTPPFDDVNVRKAVSYAFDYDVVLEDILGGGLRAAGPVPVMVPGHNPRVHMYYQDFDLAKVYLEQSKYSLKELQEMPIKLVCASGMESFRLTALLLADNLRQLGLKVEIQSELWSTICDMGTNPETSPQLFPVFIAAKYPSPDAHAFAMCHPSAWGVYQSMSWYENPVVTYLLDKARITVDTEERYRLYGEVQRIVAEDAPMIYICASPMRTAFRDYVKGYVYCGVSGHELSFYNLKVEK